MPSDIRSFFGGGSAPKPTSGKPPAKPEKKSRGRRVVSDEDEEDEDVVKPKKSVMAKKKIAPPGNEEETTTSSYFASKPKPKQNTSKSTPIRTRSAPNGTPTNGASPSTNHEGVGDDDIFADNYKSKKADDDYEEGSDDDEVLSPQGRPHARTTQKQKAEAEAADVEMADIGATNSNTNTKAKPSATNKTAHRKRKTPDMDQNDESFLDDEPKKKSRRTTSNAGPKKAKEKEVPIENKEIQEVLDSIPTVRPPTPPPINGDKKFKFQPGGGNAKMAPMAAGSKEIPEGADECLMGLTFVFTGVLDSIGREEAQNLVKRYGGKVTSAPSKKTSYVVLGSDAGPKKLETIKRLGIKTINEDGLFELIRRLPPHGGGSLAARAKAIAARTGASVPSPPKLASAKVESRLMVDKYAPDTLNAVCGNKKQVEELQQWLRNWHKNANAHFKKAGPTGKGIYRAAILHGPPGVGKTTAAHLVAHLEGFDVVETNASDTRSKKLMENSLRGVLDTTSLLGYFAADGKKVESGKKKLVFIMDEVDGMSAGDRGGVGALAAVAKKTNVPMIFICNERRLPKMKPFDFVTADFPFRRPTTDQIRSRISTICYREGIKLPMPILNAIIEGGNADIRQIINMLSTIKIDNKEMDFNDSKAMTKAWEKHVILKPWDIVNKIMRPQMFAPSSTATLNEKTELYFNDHEFSYLMLQENYLKSTPSLLSNYPNPKERNLKYLELAEKASESISDGDLVDRMIHGSQQQWSLMPLHAIFSFVKPASYVYGNFNAQVGFASWLGQNSKASKLARFVKEIQGHMRLRTSADRHEIRQQYIPALWEHTAAKLIDGGKQAVSGVIDFMDSYYLTRDDYDAIIELGVGPMDMDAGSGVKKLDSQTKATFTRLYNLQSHPMPFVKASNILGISSRTGGGKREKPDLEEAIEDSEVDEALDTTAKEEADEEEDMDLTKDKPFYTTDCIIMKYTLAAISLVVMVAAETHQVTVGPGLSYSPDSLTAAKGDVVEFTFGQGHDVVSGSFDSPCQNDGKIYSGEPGNGEVFSLTINSTDPLWIYCSVPGHCQGGMAMVINAPSGKTIDDYKSAASKTDSSNAPDSITGGVFGAVSQSSGSSSSSPGSSSTTAASSGTATSSSKSSAASSTNSGASAASSSASSASAAATPTSTGGAGNMVANLGLVGGAIFGGIAILA
ncbi:hypothetical protein DV736_g3345, partial [Chaetothyriales sp. CBS 134916]